MTSRIYEYSPEDERALIAAAGSAESKHEADWGDASLADLRTRIKKHHMLSESAKCVYCQEQIVDPHGMHWNIDHIVPKARAPRFAYLPANLVLCCWGCNQAKSDTESRAKKKGVNSPYPTDAEDFLIYNPYLDDWDEFFAKNDQTLVLIARPGNVRAAKTVEVCKLSRLAAKKAELELEAQESRSMEAVRLLVDEGHSNLLLRFIDALNDFNGSKREFGEFVARYTESVLHRT